MVTTESVRPINLKYCVSPEYLESAISLGFLRGVEDYESLSDETPREYLDHKAKLSKDATTLDSHGKLVGNEIRMDMTDLDTRSRMKCSFIAYHSLLRRNGVAWVIHNNQNAAVSHVLSAVPQSHYKTAFVQIFISRTTTAARTSKNL